MNVTIVDYQSGNISSVINSFTEVAKGKVNLDVTSNVKKIKSSDKIVLPGQGSFKSCVDSLNSINGLVDTLKEFAITKGKPLLGICVGLQMFADVGYEELETKGLGWIPDKIADDFLNFINGKKLIIHNASFDLSFLNGELNNIKKNTLKSDMVIDSLEVARNKFPGTSNSLDALCRRFNIDLSRRVKHNALLDCELLREVYINLLEAKEVNMLS